MTTRDENLVDLLLQDHESAKELLARTHSNVTPELFRDVVHTLVGHEVAEEEIVYPAFRRAGGIDTVADQRIAEQQEAEELLLKMEKMDVSSAEFAQAMSKLEKAALAHAEKEEKEVFPKLRSGLEDAELQKLGKAYTAAKAMAPTHPHPHAPNTPPGNLLGGPIAAVIDRVRDGARSAVSKATG